MKTIIKKKLFNGQVEIRSYQKDILIYTNESVKFVIDNPSLPQHGEYMILTPAKLKKGVYLNTLHSRINEGQTYDMYGYDWEGKKPEEPMDKPAEIDFKVKTRLADMWREKLKTL